VPTPDTVRDRLEAWESERLAPHATRSAASRGRDVFEEEDPYRTAFQRDRDRILHTKAFRRLKRKTQVFLSPEGDHYRTRLTHTLEVAQIARTVSRALMLNEDLTEAIALGHDLGHTPFGHAGEKVLNEEMPGGFRHYEQSLRVVEKLERRGEKQGLNLTWEVRDGIVNHSKGKALLQGKFGVGAATPEGDIVSIADAIAYISHDIEDALRAGVITLDDLPQDALHFLGENTSTRIDSMVVGLIEGSTNERIDILPDVKAAMNTLRTHMYTHVYTCEAINHEIRKAEHLLRNLFYYLQEHPTPEILEADPQDSLERRVVDFLSGMTDHYAIQLYDSLLIPRSWKA
jgi:dGTPase